MENELDYLKTNESLSFWMIWKLIWTRILAQSRNSGKVGITVIDLVEFEIANLATLDNQHH